MNVNLPPGGNDALSILAVVADPERYAAKVKDLNDLQANISDELARASEASQKASVDRAAAESALSEFKALKEAQDAGVTQREAALASAKADVLNRTDAVAAREAKVAAAEKSVLQREQSVTASEKKLAVDLSAAEIARNDAVKAKTEADARLARIIEASK